MSTFSEGLFIIGLDVISTIYSVGAVFYAILSLSELEWFDWSSPVPMASFIYFSD